MKKNATRANQFLSSLFSKLKQSAPIVGRLVSALFGLISKIIRIILKLIFKLIWLVIRIIALPFKHQWAGYLAALLFVLLMTTIVMLMQQLPSPRKLTSNDKYAVSTLIYDRHGTLLYEVFADENRIPIQLEEVPDHVKQATIAIEDKNFYRHLGLDVTGIVRAMRNNLQSDSLEGGSTITQQLVKNALLSPERSFTRKAKEAILALMTEVVYTKEEILEMYLNYISYGGTSVGIESASQRYFDKSAKDLTLAQASLLAGLPKAPTLYSPFGSSPDKGKARQTEVLRRMVEEDFITQEQADQARTENIDLAISRTDIKAPHFVMYVKDLLYEKYGVKKVEKGGLRVYTTLDLPLHEKAQEIVSSEVESLKNYRVGNGSAIITKPNTGEILAMVGSRDYFDTSKDGQVNVTLALRQPGSSIKPLMYATTFQEKTLNPGTILVDQPTCFNIPGQKAYCPRNYDGGFKGPVTVRESLGNSLNIPAVKALSTIGVPAFIKQAEKMGITTWQDPANYGLSLTLGGGDVRMIDMAQAYGSLANQGVRVPLVATLKVEDYTGKVIDELNLDQRLEDLDYLTNYENNGKKNDLRRVMDRSPAYLTSHIMQDNNARRLAFGANSSLVIPDQVVSAKTGTTNNLRDNWTLGFTPEYLVISWVGNNDSTNMSYLVSGVTGAAPIWHDIMSQVLSGKEPVWQEKPPAVAQGQICATGMPPEESKERDCQVRGTEYYWKESRPSNSKLAKQKVWINPETGLPPEPGKHIEGLVLEERMMYQDPVSAGLGFCQDCEVKTDGEGRPIHQTNVNLTDDQKAAE